MKCDAVFEGGGVKGIAFIGAIQETLERGYTYHNVAGTSAGSIIASLIAAEYTVKELEEMMFELPFLHFLNRNLLNYIPILGTSLNIFLKNGIYSAKYIEQWMNERLIKKGIRTFGDLPEGKLKIIASDITLGRIMTLPDDLYMYNIDWRRFPIATAVRMSSTIPYFFQPFILQRGKEKSYIVDGGLLSNYPIWIFDLQNETPKWPTFGYRLRGAERVSPAKIIGPITMLKALISTMIEAHDRRHIEDGDAARTIFIPVDFIKATDFSITEKEKKMLVKLGRIEAKQFFDHWSFADYIEKHRTPQDTVTQNNKTSQQSALITVKNRRN